MTRTGKLVILQTCLRLGKPTGRRSNDPTRGIDRIDSRRRTIVRGEAQAEEKEPSAIVEVGGASEWSLPGGASSFGPLAAIEFTPIKEWLEIEAGVSTLFSAAHTEWQTDLLFKKPFTLSDKLEFMVGVGPEWSYTTGGGTKTAGEFALDFMYWPTADRKFGWFVEPSYSYSFSKEHEQSFGVTTGLLIPIR
jgi:hypothetical protein